MSDHFKKFMDAFQKKDKQKVDKHKEYVENHADSPNRKYNELYRERWFNRIKWGNKK